MPNRGSRAGERRPVAVDLFAGAGGLSLGFEQAGFDILASVEYDPVHTAVHAFNFPQTEVICADASTLTARRVREAAARGWRAHGRAGEWDRKIDVVVGGPPCQGFSQGGKREFDDARNQLVFSFARLVGALKPRYFVMENVPGMASVRAGADQSAPLLLELLIEEFEAFNYAVAPPQILNAAALGVPQHRRRLLLVGARQGNPLPAEVQATSRPRTRGGEAQIGKGPDRTLPLCPSVDQALCDLPNLDDYDDLLISDEVRLRKVSHQKASEYAGVLNGSVADGTDFSWPRQWDRDVLTSSSRTIHTPAVVGRFEKTAPGRAEPISRLFRLHLEGASPTLRAGTHYERGSFNAPRPIHPTYPRVISVREAARLHSFPDWFRLHWTKWHGFREIGNALPPFVGRAVGAQVGRALGISPFKPTRTLSLGERDLLYLENLEAAERFNADKSRIPRNALRSRSPAGLVQAA